MHANLLSVALLLALAGPVAAQESQIVFDLSPFTPDAVGGEIIAISSASGHVVHGRIDVTFVSEDPGPWTLFADFALPTGIAGFDSQIEGWDGVGSFSKSIETDAFNGLLAPPDGAPFYTWYMQWVGGTPFTLPGGGTGMGPVDGVFTQLVLTLTVCDCPLGTWVDLGHALAGTLGEPQLVGNGNLCPSAPGSFVLSNANPGATTFFVFGLASVWAPFRGGLLIPQPDFIFVLPVNAGGGNVLPFNFPNGVPMGLSLWFQHWIADPAGPAGFSASNALLATVPSDC